MPIITYKKRGEVWRMPIGRAEGGGLTLFVFMALIAYQNMRGVSTYCQAKTAVTYHSPRPVCGPFPICGACLCHHCPWCHSPHRSPQPCCSHHSHPHYYCCHGRYQSCCCCSTGFPSWCCPCCLWWIPLFLMTCSSHVSGLRRWFLGWYSGTSRCLGLGAVGRWLLQC